MVAQWPVARSQFVGTLAIQPAVTLNRIQSVPAHVHVTAQSFPRVIRIRKSGSRSLMTAQTVRSARQLLRRVLWRRSWLWKLLVKSLKLSLLRIALTLCLGLTSPRAAVLRLQ